MEDKITGNTIKITKNQAQYMDSVLREIMLNNLPNKKAENLPIEVYGKMLEMLRGQLEDFKSELSKSFDKHTIMTFLNPKFVEVLKSEVVSEEPSTEPNVEVEKHKPNARISNQLKAQIYDYAKKGHSYRETAKKFNVSRSSVNDIIFKTDFNKAKKENKFIKFTPALFKFNKNLQKFLEEAYEKNTTNKEINLAMKAKFNIESPGNLITNFRKVFLLSKDKGMSMEDVLDIYGYGKLQKVPIKTLPGYQTVNDSWINQTHKLKVVD